MRKGEPIRYVPDQDMVLIPPGDPKVTTAFAVFDDSFPALRTFVLGHLKRRAAIVTPPRGVRGDALIPVVIGLVPRPDNTYNSQAISVTAPPHQGGGSVLDRHMGYVYDSLLHFQGESLHRLAEASPAPVGCHGWIALDPIDEDHPDLDPQTQDWTPDRHRPFTRAEQIGVGHWIGDIRLNLPDKDELRALVAAFDPSAVPSPAGTRERVEPITAPAPPPPTAKADEEAAARLRTWQRWRRHDHDYEDLRAESRTVYGRPSVLVVDRAGLQVGQYHLPDGPLTLVDERARPQALDALRHHGVQPVQPVQVRPVQGQPIDSPKLSELDAFPDAHIVPGDVWSIRLVEESVALRDLPEAGSYDPGSRTLTVHARPYTEPMTVLLRRHGVEPATVVTAAPDRATEEHNRRAASAATQAGPLRSSCLLTPHALDLVPARHRRWLGAQRASASPATAAAAVSDTPYYRRELEAMFGAPVVPDRVSPCRLCGRPAYEARPGLAYCFACCRLAQRGVIRDNGTDGPWTDAIIHAVRRLVEIEFSGPPSLAQLARVSVTDPRVADEAMLCRFLVPRPIAKLTTARPARRLRSWAEWLQLAGVLDDGIRQARGTLTVATDGHLCRSMLERHIDDFFHHWRIGHEPEPHYPRHPELNTTGLRADWLLDDGTFVEALGLMEQERYADKARRKTALADLTDIRLVTVTAADLHRLPEIFAHWLPTRSGRPAPARRPDR
ncbi:hypothetical protein [Streptomyces vilmorinianum]|uniref:hypothetical protein n=1 Tax=Streptomyces vilmorinianum TaxID=3051092 RepID=UPI0010FB0BC4|nr:hypothetical protein [Streptomyces vilmorinianum]